MMSYSVITTEKEVFDILEKDSGNVIEVKKIDEQEVRSLCRKLNLGAGFNGWTPEFVAKKMFA
jgi:hypothetical protein